MKSDLALYDYNPWPNRPPIRWPGGARVAFWVAPNIEFYELDPPANPTRKAWARPYPDMLAYTERDYGNRVGHERLMEVMDRYGVRGSVSLSVALMDHHPEIIEQCKARDWELFSHGIYNTRYVYGMSEAQERAIIEDSIRSVQECSGQRIHGWLAPALTHTERTMDLLAEHEILYTCDLFHDDQPQPVNVKKGRLISIPYSLEMNDVIAYNVQKETPRRYGQMLKNCFDRLYEEGRHNGTVMCIPLHAYLVGHPHRMEAFEDALRYIVGHRDVWVTTGREIAQHYLAHHYDEQVEHLSRVRALSRSLGAAAGAP